jgi:hypothetical protein
MICGREQVIICGCECVNVWSVVSPNFECVYVRRSGWMPWIYRFNCGFNEATRQVGVTNRCIWTLLSSYLPPGQLIDFYPKYLNTNISPAFLIGRIWRMVICKLAVRQMRKNTLVILIFTSENLIYNEVNTSLRRLYQLCYSNRCWVKTWVVVVK